MQARVPTQSSALSKTTAAQEMLPCRNSWPCNPNDPVREAGSGQNAQKGDVLTYPKSYKEYT